MYLKRTVFQKLDNRYLFFFILIISFCIRIVNFNTESLWTDELISAYASNPFISLRRTYNVLHFWDQTPPLYPVMLWVWLKIFGFTEFQIRFFSLVGGILSIVAVYFLIKEMYNRKTALIVVFVLAFLPYHIYFSREARSYIWAFLVTTVVLLFFIKQLKDYKSGKLRFLFVVFGGILMLTSYFSFFVLAGLVLILLMAYIFKTHNINLKNWLVDFICIGLLFTPWLYQFIRILGFHNGENGSSPSFSYIFKIFHVFSGTQAGGLLLISIYIILVGAFIISAVKNYSSFSQNALILYFMVFFLAIFILLYIKSSGGRNVLNGFAYSYVIILFPVFLILLGRLFYRASDSIIYLFLICFLIVCIAKKENWIKYAYKKVQAEPYRELADFINKSSYPNTPILCTCPYIHEFYFFKLRKQNLLIDTDYFKKNDNKTLGNNRMWIIDTYNLKAEELLREMKTNYPIIIKQYSKIKANSTSTEFRAILIEFI